MINVLIMVGGPMIVLAVDPNAAMLICMVLFFVLNPLCVLYSGAFAGSRVKVLWSLPLITDGLFLLGAWWLLSMDAMGLWLYGVAYLMIGLISMFVSTLIHSRKA